METSDRKILGRCHCGNISHEFTWPFADGVIPTRACGCSFCQKHGAVYTSHRDARLNVTVASRSMAHSYRFGHETADFLLCTRCGVIVMASCEIDGKTRAVINVNTFDEIRSIETKREATNFDGESVEGRLERRRRNWTPEVSIQTSE